MDDIVNSQIHHFRHLFLEHKGTPMAVSSESYSHKKLRYDQLSLIFEGDRNFSIHDVGMGVADYYSFLLASFPDVRIDYSGSEILPEYCEEATYRYPKKSFSLRDISSQPFEDRYDYVVMSGVFHQRRETTIPEWEKYSQRLLQNSYAMCRKGIGFNFISPFVDFYQTEVYYCNLFKLLNFIASDLSRFFVIHHNYALFEFTVFVYRPEFVKAKFPQPEFGKYFKGIE